MNLSAEGKLFSSRFAEIRPQLLIASANLPMQKEIVTAEAEAVDIAGANAFFYLSAKLWRLTFVDIHVKQPVATGRRNAFVSLMAEIFARKPRR